MTLNEFQKIIENLPSDKEPVIERFENGILEISIKNTNEIEETEFDRKIRVGN